MKNNKLQTGIEEVKKIVMTDIEKEKIFTNIMNSSFKEKKPILSKWVSYSFFASFRNNKLEYYIIVPLIIILTSGGVAFASQNSLPDSILYPVKVHIVEPIGETLSLTPKAKANYESKLASNRLAEAEILARNDKLDPSSEEKINNLLIKHTKALDKAIRKMDNPQLKVVSDKITTNFSEEMNVRANTLENITKEKSKKIENQRNEIKNKEKISDDAEIKIEDINLKLSELKDDISNINNEDDSHEEENKREKSDHIDDHNKISKTAIMSAIKIKNTSDRIKEENSNKYKDKYKDRKEKGGEKRRD